MNISADKQQHKAPARRRPGAGVERHKVRHGGRDQAAHRYELQRRRRLLRARGPLQHRGHHCAVQESTYDLLCELLF